MAPPIYAHPVSGETVLPLLQDLLPYPLPLYGRLKFHHRSPASHLLASFPPPQDPSAPATGADAPTASKCFAIAYVDRSRRPETECWLFASGEVPGRCTLSASGGETAQCADCSAAVLALVDAIAALPVPASIHDADALVAANPAMAGAMRGDILLLGQLHEACTRIVRGATAGAHAAAPVPGIDFPYVKYLFQPGALAPPRPLLPGLRWGALRTRDFALVRNRTHIPRQDATLALLPSLAMFPEEGEGVGPDPEPVGWAFLGVDGSLTSLHTEPEYRGKGLAKTLVGKLFRDGSFASPGSAAVKGGAVGSDGKVWFHGDVALDNVSSRKVCGGLGGEESWIVYWVRIDLKEKTRSHTIM